MLFLNIVLIKSIDGMGSSMYIASGGMVVLSMTMPLDMKCARENDRE